VSFATADRFFFDDMNLLLADLEEVVKLGSSFNYDWFW